MERYDSLREAFVDRVVQHCDAFGEDLKKALAEAALKTQNEIRDRAEDCRNIPTTANTGKVRYEQFRRATNACDDITGRKYVDKTTSTKPDSLKNNCALPEDIHTPHVNQVFPSFAEETLPPDEKYNTLLKKYNRMRQQAQQYKNGFETYKEAYAELKERFNRSKVNIKEWQDFADRVRAKFNPGTRLNAGHAFDSPRPRPLRRHSLQEEGRSGWPQRPERGHTEKGATNEAINLPIMPLSMDVEDNHNPRDSKLDRAHSSCNISQDLPPLNNEATDDYQLVALQVDTNSSNPTDPVRNHSSSNDNGLFHPSSQTTEEEISSKAVFTRSDDDSEPVVVSERSLKRKRSTRNGDSSSRLKKCMLSSQDGSTRKPIKIKDEPLSSSPVGPVAIPGLIFEESLDLDDVQGFVFTPRKRKERRERRERMQEATRHKTSSRHLQSQRRETVGTRATSAPVDSANETVGNQIPALESRVTRSFEHNSKEEGADDEMLLTGDADLTSDKSLAEGSESVIWNETFRRRSDVLQPRSVNDIVAPRGNDKIARRKTFRSIKEREIAELAEDGETHAELQPPPTHRKPSSTRIHHLLEGGGVPNKTPLRSPPSSRSSTYKSAPLQSAAPQHTSTGNLTTPSISRPRKDDHSWMRHSMPTPGPRLSRTPASALATTKLKMSPRAMRERSDPARPEQEPMRARPLNRLDLECFKINPKSNNGYNHAFNEVVRNHAARACLPGCTLPSCCGGAFEKAIELGGALPPPKRGLWDDSQEDPDDTLLKEYLGGNHSRINAMAPQERARLLTKARANKLAEMHGKHRQAHQRQASPPGFWRMEMPTTQENEEDRRKAKELEREKVAERYREAIRPGGRWVFADE